MQLFGRKLEGAARHLVIFATILLIASGLCGLQIVIQNHVSEGVSELFIVLGILELIAMLISAVGILIMLLVLLIDALQGGTQPTSPSVLNLSDTKDRFPDKESDEKPS